MSSTTLDILFDDIFKYTFASFECQVIRNKLEIIILEKRNDSQEKEIFHSIDTKRRFTNIYHNEKKEEEKKETIVKKKKSSIDTTANSYITMIAKLFFN